MCERERDSLLQFKVVPLCSKKPIIMREIDTHTCKHGFDVYFLIFLGGCWSRDR